MAPDYYTCPVNDTSTPPSHVEMTAGSSQTLTFSGGFGLRLKPRASGGDSVRIVAASGGCSVEEGGTQPSPAGGMSSPPTYMHSCAKFTLLDHKGWPLSGGTSDITDLGPDDADDEDSATQATATLFARTSLCQTTPKNSRRAVAGTLLSSRHADPTAWWVGKD